MMGPGKYDDVCTIARELTGGTVVMVVVVDGRRGTGFSVQSTGLPNARALAQALRAIAAEIEADTEKGGES